MGHEGNDRAGRAVRGGREGGWRCQRRPTLFQSVMADHCHMLIGSTYHSNLLTRYLLSRCLPPPAMSLYLRISSVSGPEFFNPEYFLNQRD